MLPDNQAPSPSKKLREEKEDSVPKDNPPLFSKRLIHPNQNTLEETELLGELKNLCVKITLFQAIKDVLIYKKLIKDKFFKHPRKRNKDTTTINSIGQLSDLILGRVIFQKYLGHRSSVVDVHIDDIIVPHILIDLGAAINAMNKETMLKLNLQGYLRETTIVLQLENSSTIAHEGVFKDVMVSID